MIWRVKRWIARGIEVRIVTARVNPLDHEESDIRNANSCLHLWCLMHVGSILPIQSCKSSGMIEFWDDKAVRVEPNTGRRLSPSEIEKDD